MLKTSNALQGQVEVNLLSKCQFHSQIIFSASLKEKMKIYPLHCPGNQSN